MSKVVEMKGDLSVGAYRRPTKDKRKLKERKDFEAKITTIKKGYKAKKNLESYSIDRTLGTGSFGRVLLVLEKKTKDSYAAIKIISKETVIKTRQVQILFIH